MPSPDQDGGGGGLLGRSGGLCGKEVGEQASWGGPALVLPPGCGQAGTLFFLFASCVEGLGKRRRLPGTG